MHYLPGFKNIAADYLSRNFQEQDPWTPLNSFHISSITLQNDSFLSEFINLIQYQENSYPENSHLSKSHPPENSPRKTPTQKTPTWNIPTYVFKYSNPSF